MLGECGFLSDLPVLFLRQTVRDVKVMVPTATVTLISSVSVRLCRTLDAVEFMPPVCAYGMASTAAVYRGSAQSSPMGKLLLNPLGCILDSLMPV